MTTATFNGVVIAESDDTVIIEGNHYFPMSSVVAGHLTATDHSTHCHWKGNAAYYTISAGGESFENGAWYYPEPLEKAAEIKDHVAFYTSRVTVS